MPNLFQPSADLVLRTVLVGVGAAALGAAGGLLLYGVPAQSYAMDRHIEQPVMFSHEHHVGALGLDCMYCHESASKSPFAGMPPAETCMNCHAELYTTAPMLEPVRQAWTDMRPVRWRRVYNLPDYVRFSHRVHVNAGVGCASCHGDMARQPLTAQQTPLTMGWCLDCHRHPESTLLNDPRPPESYTLGAAKPLSVDRRSLLTNCSACHY